MKLYFKNLIHDIKVTLESIRYWGSYSWYDIETMYLQWKVLRMLSLKYPDGDVTKEPLDEVSAKRYDKQMKRIEKKILNKLLSLERLIRSKLLKQKEKKKQRRI